ncbi:diaminopimelate epimerase [Sinorhizobium medicae]|uniref:diaminopimelate epimerase n=1 Tax=Sinorhizobium medicae TaxID=110321 RepID=UPI0012950E1A|nr:diaminopimelate epimerase [Sinorhizobium medicae]MDX0967871.1 diaminopimelate epimerase [Sinorhizobium medicae]MQV49884.1 diaminopimelate epimerase [Sinorhizobium medicae]MQV55669.1 diaminopimelate epimerase [Sinorhizobium medicae]MQV75334.1 diaminopimelate epimerase [Sinorhizobium medicae]
MNHMKFLSQSSPVGAPNYWPFVKMHGLENYFVILDRREIAKKFEVEDIIRICSTNVGAGGEQLLTIERPSPDGLMAGAYAAMRIFNIDGKEASACGNATRCMAYLLLEETGLEHVLIETAAGVLSCRRTGLRHISVKLGPISLDWRQVPTSREINTLHLPLESGTLSDGVALHIGIPHAVFFVDRLVLDDIPRFAPAIQNHPLFPEGVNVSVAEVVDTQTIRLAVWERPGILTKACGTGACVAAYAAMERGYVSASKVEVHLPGGQLQIELIENDMVIMTGPVAFCCHGFIEAGAMA